MKPNIVAKQQFQLQTSRTRIFAFLHCNKPGRPQFGCLLGCWRWQSHDDSSDKWQTNWAFSRFLDNDIEDDCRESGMPGASKKTFFCWTFLEPLHVSVWTWFFVKKTLSLTWCSRNHFAHLLQLIFFYLELTYIIEVHKFAPFVFFCWKLTCFIQILPNTFPRIFSNILGSRKNFHAFTGGGMRRAWHMAWSSKIFRVLSGVCVVRGEAKPLLKSKVKLYNIDPFCRRKNHHSWTGIM